MIQTNYTFPELFNRAASWIIDQPFRPLDNQVATKKNVQTIPTNVFQTWEENSFGRRHRKSMNRFRQSNSNLNFILFDKNQRDNYMKEWAHHPISELYFRARFGPLKADIFRYCILFSRGGYYFDISKGIEGSITALHHPESREIISFENNENQETDREETKLLYPNKLVIQWGMGFVPGHEILRLLIEQIVEDSADYLNQVQPNPKDAILKLTGPHAMTKAVHLAARFTGAKYHQVGIDFNGLGIYSMRGSGARHLKYPTYAKTRNEPLFV